MSKESKQLKEYYIKDLAKVDEDIKKVEEWVVGHAEMSQFFIVCTIALKALKYQRADIKAIIRAL